MIMPVRGHRNEKGGVPGWGRLLVQRETAWRLAGDLDVGVDDAGVEFVVRRGRLDRPGVYNPPVSAVMTKVMSYGVVEKAR